MLSRLPVFALVLVLLCFYTASSAGSDPAKIQSLRSWQAPDHTRLVFDLTRKTDHNIFRLQNPERLVIDIDNARLLKQDIIQADMNLPVTRIRHGNHGGSLRLVVDLSYRIHARSFLLEPNESYGYRLIVDMYGTDDSAKSASQTKANSKNADDQRDVVVVIDAGHGGDDVGAISASGAYEKDLVLDYAIRIKKELDAVKGVRAKLTRKDDYFIGLRQRTQIAGKLKADLFISVHANSLTNSPNTRGFIIFALSDKGATSEIGRLLVKAENRSDAIGGTDNLSLVGKSRDLRKVLLDLSLTSVVNHSIFAGKSILRSVGRYADVHTSHVEQAAFTVLKSADIPALLIELGFLSNREEEKLLTQPWYRKKMVIGIRQGIVNYLNMYPPYGTFFAARKSDSSDVYLVKSGDTLSEIAEKHNLDAEELRRINDIQGSRILSGQKLHLRVADSNIHLAKKQQQDFYLVESGDTLGEIAEKFSVNINHLRKLNGISGSTIRSGQKIWLYKGGK